MPNLRSALLLCTLSILSACSLFDTVDQSKTAQAPAAQQNTKQSDTSSSQVPSSNIDQASSTPDTRPQQKPTDELWSVIRDGYGLSAHQHAKIDAQRKWYAKHPTYMKRVSQRAQPYLYFISQELKLRNMPMELALLPIVESAFDPFAYSHGRASGLWQFTPPTAKDFGLHSNWWFDGRRDVEASTRAALDYLSKLHKRFDGDWLLALAAYNAGGGTVNKAIKRNKRKGKATDFWSLKLPKETQTYVPRLLGISQIIGKPEAYNVTLQAISNQPYFTRFDLSYQLDLAQAAKLAELDIEEIYQLNPGYNRWATDPDGAQHILIPNTHAERFGKGIAALNPKQRLAWKRYTVKSGDTLGKIASRHNLKLQELQSINKLNSHVIQIGQALFIPTSAEPSGHYTFSLDQRQARNSGSAKVRRYTVKRGDSLWSISRRFGVDFADIARWNKMNVKATLKPGKKLLVYPKTNKYAQGKTRISYKVRKGDSIARIAQKYGTSISAIVRANGLNPKRYLQPGQALTLLIDPARG